MTTVVHYWVTVDTLPPGTLETLVAAAQSAASTSNLQLWSVIAVEDAGRKARLAQPVLAFRERYAPQAEMEHVANYDETVAAFSRGQGMGNVNWTDRVFARMAGLNGMNGRDRMRSMVKALGFELR